MDQKPKIESLITVGKMVEKSGPRPRVITASPNIHGLLSGLMARAVNPPVEVL
jgi:hypothetical protein